jgi:hypothetical protein
MCSTKFSKTLSTWADQLRKEKKDNEMSYTERVKEIVREAIMKTTEQYRIECEKKSNSADAEKVFNIISDGVASKDTQKKLIKAIERFSGKSLIKDDYITPPIMSMIKTTDNRVAICKNHNGSGRICYIDEENTSFNFLSPRYYEPACNREINDFMNRNTIPITIFVSLLEHAKIHKNILEDIMS